MSAIEKKESARADAPPRAFDSLLLCPACGEVTGSWQRSADGLQCDSCLCVFPEFCVGSKQIPWLFRDPSAELAQWRASYHGFQQQIELEIDRLRAALADNSVLPVVAGRLQHLLTAKQQFIQQANDLLEPLGGGAKQALTSTSSNLWLNQSLQERFDTTFRDWHWQTGEIEALFQPVKALLQDANLPRPHNLLCVGAGAGRMSYELNDLLEPESTIYFDVDPLLTSIAANVASGRTVSLFEFPAAPLTSDDQAVLRECRLPKGAGLAKQVNLVCGDIMNPPFMPQSIDVLFTPWLIDVLPHKLSTQLPRFNNLLEVGGVWINSGSLVFHHEDPAANHLRWEIPQLLALHGFEMIGQRDDKLTYMQSPSSAIGRVESVYSFVARKVEHVAAPESVTHQTDWMRDTALAIRSTPELVLRSSDMLLRAQVLAAVDGRRSIAQIAQALAQQYELDITDAHNLVRIILSEFDTPHGN